MIEIPLTQGYVMWCDDVDAALARGHKWYAYRNGHRVYAVWRPLDRSPLWRFHRVVMGALPGQDVDHIKGANPVGLRVVDNQRGNLRVCRRVENTRGFRTKSAKASSRFRGVYFYPPTRTWRAKIRISSGPLYLGNFTAEEDAARAYDVAACEHFGEFASLNFPT